jgi:hypothetical protein
MLEDAADFLYRAGKKTRYLFLVALFLLEWLAPLYSGRLARMSGLPFEVRVRALERLDATPFSLVLALPKAVLCMIYYEHPDALAETGYDGRPLVTTGRLAPFNPVSGKALSLAPEPASAAKEAGAKEPA